MSVTLQQRAVHSPGAAKLDGYDGNLECYTTATVAIVTPMPSINTMHARTNVDGFDADGALDALEMLLIEALKEVRHAKRHPPICEVVSLNLRSRSR